MFILQKVFGLKVVSHYHGNPINLKGRTSIPVVVFRMLCERSDINVFLCTSHLSIVRKKLRRKAVVLPNFIDDHSFQKLSDKREFNSSNLKGIYVGAVTEQKGIFELIQIAKDNLDITFQIIGKIMSDLSGYNDHPSNFKMYGSLDRTEVLKYMTDSDFLIFPSHTEGFPFVVLEALRWSSNHIY